MVSVLPTSGSRRRWGLPVRALLLVLAAAALSACAWFGDNDLPLSDDPPDRLYNEGLYLLNNKRDFKAAAKKFEEVDRQHPYSEWARKSLIMSAYAYYSAGAYDESINAAKRYITLHPGSADAAYAQYLIGASYFDQIPDVTRDQSRTERAIAALEEVSRKFPNSEYADSARKKIEVGRDQLAAKEMEVGRWNLNKKNFTGAINRFKVVVTQYQRTRHVEEALERLAECYMALGFTQEAQTAAAVLGHNFPDSPWYKDAYRLVKSGGTEPTENKDSWMSKAFRSLNPWSKSDRTNAAGN
jgi:outer membrane protein assembly factor BamD